MPNHNLSPEEYNYHQMRAAYWAIEEEDAEDDDRRELCHNMREESLRKLGFFAFKGTQVPDERYQV